MATKTAKALPKIVSAAVWQVAHMTPNMHSVRVPWQMGEPRSGIRNPRL